MIVRMCYWMRGTIMLDHMLGDGGAGTGRTSYTEWPLRHTRHAALTRPPLVLQGPVPELVVDGATRGHHQWQTGRCNVNTAPPLR